MKAISVRAPWWWAILHGGKDIENRDWRSSFRGTVLLHASSWHGIGDVSDDMLVMAEILRKTEHRPPRGALTPDGKLTHGLLKASRGCIVGTVEVVDCVPLGQHDSPWFFGEYGFVLRTPVAFAEPIRCKGALGFFSVPEEVADAARRQAGGQPHA